MVEEPKLDVEKGAALITVEPLTCPDAVNVAPEANVPPVLSKASPDLPIGPKSVSLQVIVKEAAAEEVARKFKSNCGFVALPIAGLVSPVSTLTVQLPSEPLHVTTPAVPEATDQSVYVPVPAELSAPSESLTVTVSPAPSLNVSISNEAWAEAIPAATQATDNAVFKSNLRFISTFRFVYGSYPRKKLFLT